MELSRKLAGGGGGSKKTEAETIIKKLTDAQEKEKECQKVSFHTLPTFNAYIVTTRHWGLNIITLHGILNASLIFLTICSKGKT